jgi:hypothetical protein
MPVLFFPVQQQMEAGSLKVDSICCSAMPCRMCLVADDEISKNSIQDSILKWESKSPEEYCEGTQDCEACKTR